MANGAILVKKTSMWPTLWFSVKKTSIRLMVWSSVEKTGMRLWLWFKFICLTNGQTCDNIFLKAAAAFWRSWKPLKICSKTSKYLERQFQSSPNVLIIISKITSLSYDVIRKFYHYCRRYCLLLVTLLTSERWWLCENRLFLYSVS